MPEILKPDTAASAGAGGAAAAEASPEKKLKVEILKRNADLFICPKALPVNEGHTHVTLGDLHGNAMNLIYTLIEEGFLEISEDDYNILYDIYDKPVHKLTREDIDDFKGVIEAAKINKHRAITLIGDELADRGKNDFFTMIVLKRLHEEDVDIDILLSNHSVDFIKETRGFKGNISADQRRSFQNLAILMNKGIISAEEIESFITDHYVHIVKAISYTVSDDGKPTLFMHAPIGLETIEALAKKLGIDYDEKTPAALMRTIDSINKKITELFARGELAELLKEEERAAFRSDPVMFKADKPKPIPLDFPLMRLVWNRAFGPELRTKPNDKVLAPETADGAGAAAGASPEKKLDGSYEVNFVHGHIGPKPMLDKDGNKITTHTNTDSLWAKSDETTKARIGSPVEHYTLQSPDTPTKTVKYHLRRILNEIKAAGIKEMAPFIEEQKLAIDNATDNAVLREIKVGLEATLAPLAINKLKTESHAILAEIGTYGVEGMDKFIEEQKLAIDNATDKAVLQGIKAGLEAKLNPLVMNKLKTESHAILNDVIANRVEGMEKFIRKQASAIDRSTDKADLQAINKDLTDTLARLALNKLKAKSHTILSSIKTYHFEGMDSFIRKQTIAIENATDKATLKKIDSGLKKKLSELEMIEINDLKTKSQATLDQIAAIYRAIGAIKDIDKWVEVQKATIGAFTDKAALQASKTGLDEKLMELNLRAQINELRTELAASLAELTRGDDRKLDKFVTEQHLAINRAIEKIRGPADIAFLKVVADELVGIGNSITDKIEGKGDEHSSSAPENKGPHHVVAAYKDELHKLAVEGGDKPRAGAGADPARSDSNEGPT